MKKFLIIIVLGLTGCVSTNDNQSNNNNDNDNQKKQHVFYKNGLYEMRKISEKEILTDSVWYYTDKELTNLVTKATAVRLTEGYRTNQIINYLDGKIDSSRSIFFKFKYYANDSINIIFHSKFKDSVGLILGDLNSNYDLLPGMESDTIHCKDGNVTIPRKYYYKRGKVSFYQEEDSYYKSMQLYIPERFLVK
mgnify:FL=1